MPFQNQKSKPKFPKETIARRNQYTTEHAGQTFPDV
jgi:hypothetical protein